MPAELLVLRLIHILGGIVWVGSGIFNFFFLVPALGRTGPATAGQVMGALQQRHLFTVLPLSAVLTILSGLRLWWIIGGRTMHYWQHRSGHVYLVSGVLAIVGFLLAMFVSRPAAVRMGALARSAPSDEGGRRELASLQRRATVSGYVAMILLIVAAAGMAVARYL
jgi:uncharacterized membrane protein